MSEGFFAVLVFIAMLALYAFLETHRVVNIVVCKTPQNQISFVGTKTSFKKVTALVKDLDGSVCTEKVLTAEEWRLFRYASAESLIPQLNQKH